MNQFLVQSSKPSNQITKMKDHLFRKYDYLIQVPMMESSRICYQLERPFSLKTDDLVWKNSTLEPDFQ